MTARDPILAAGLAVALVAGLVAVLTVLPAAPVRAGDDGGVGRLAEMPAHRALMARVAATGAALAPFETDGCSGGLSSSWELVADRFPDFADVHEQAPPWESCCVVHDRAYHDAGGATGAGASFDARLAADTALRACVIDTGETRIDQVAAVYDVPPDQVRAAYRTIAGAMYLAVRFGGGPCSGLPWRWGFGYAHCALSDFLGK